jgi:hypothetical protein
MRWALLWGLLNEAILLHQLTHHSHLPVEFGPQLGTNLDEFVPFNRHLHDLVLQTAHFLL